MACRIAPYLALAVAAALLTAQAPSERFDKREAMVAMRDGVKLHTEIYVPKDRPTPVPILFERTPYGIAHDDKGFAGALSGSYRELAAAGFAFALQDIRGKYGSEGTFVMIRPPRAGAETIDENTDTNDTIDWLLREVKDNNGRVGMLGISYGGWLTMMALVDPHPALRAASPQASPDCMWTGDDFHHNGAFRLSYGFEYVALVDGGRENVAFAFDKLDTYDWFLRLGGLRNVDARHFHGERPTWTDFAAHPDFDAFWRRRKVAPYFADKPVTVPTLTVAGWWDQEDFYGPLTLYEAMERNDPRGLNHLVVGPWNHGGWARGDGSSLGPIQFGSATAKHFRENVQLKWFRHWLADDGPRDFPEALTFRAGANAWQRHSAWPPVAGVAPRRLFLQPGGRLGFDPPRPGGEAFSSYVSDPRHPVPYRQRPIAPLYRGKVPSTWSQWLVDDQRHAESRPDVLTFTSDVLAADLTISGHVSARLCASSSGTDCDLVVKLIDVYPDDHAAEPRMSGYQLMVGSDVFRARYRNGFERPEPLVPDQVFECAIDLHAADYTFLAGHRLMVQVQSTWFPLIDRNPQKFVPNIFAAADEDYVSAVQRVFHAPEHASCIEIAVAEAPAAK